MKKETSFPLDPGEWLTDPGLRLCSTLARGLLIELLCFCFKSDRRGYLIKPNSEPWTAKDAQRAAGRGLTYEEVKTCWDELHANQVLKVEESTGCSYSPLVMRGSEQ